jgi:outer membrane protein TolC
MVVRSNKIFMKLVFNLLVFSFFGPLAFAQAQPMSANPEDRVVLQNYTLAQCIEYAVAHSVAVKNAQVDVATAKAQVGLVRADGLPQVNGSYSQNGNIKPQVFFFPATLAGDPNAPAGEFVAVPAQAAHTGNAGINGSQMLFDGVFFLGLKAAQVYTELAEKGITRSRIDVATAVSKAYYGLLVGQERIALLNNNLARLEALLRETKAMNEQGFVEKIDVDRIEVNLNNLRTEQQRNTRLIDLSKALLKFQMGLRQTDELTIGQSLKDLKLDAAALTATEAFEPSTRIEYSILETQRKLDLMNIRRNKLEYLPKLSLIGNYSATTAQPTLARLYQFSQRWVTFASVGLNLQVPIFDGLRKKYIGEQRRLALVKTENQMQDLRRSFELETNQSAINLQNALDNLKVQQRNLDLAAEVARVTKVKYKEGLGSNIEVVNAENEHKTAETNYYNALYEALMAKVDLDKAQGKLQP